MSTTSGLRIGLIEPHLRRYGGIRRVLEFSNRLVARGHEVTFYLPDDQVLNCTWMRCDAAIKTLSSGFGDPLDIIVFNHEPHWHLLDRFEHARRRIFYALHYSRTYHKAGSWESIRTPVDLQLANSNWTADQIEAEIGSRPVVQLGGANREVFHPYGGPKQYPILSVGDCHREWKGHETILEAGRMLDLPIEEYGPKNLSQADLGREYDAAEVFVVGSWFEGFCQPGLEAMACGVPLVTTDNGGCREYAIDGETALVVPPRDPVAMANAIRRLLNDEVLAKQLVTNGLDLVERDFDWEQPHRRAGRASSTASAPGTALAPPPPWPTPPERPELSVVIAGLGQPALHPGLRRVGAPEHRRGLRADHRGQRLGLGGGQLRGGRGRHQRAERPEPGLRGRHEPGPGRGPGRRTSPSATTTRSCRRAGPPSWCRRLATHPSAGIVVPALTAANNADTVRTEPGDDVVVLPPFSAPPGAVHLPDAHRRGQRHRRWGEEYEVASGEDVDLAFKVWVNDLDIVYDQRVLVDHVGKGSASRLEDWKGLVGQEPPALPGQVDRATPRCPASIPAIPSASPATGPPRRGRRRGWPSTSRPATARRRCATCSSAHRSRSAPCACASRPCSCASGPSGCSVEAAKAGRPQRAPGQATHATQGDAVGPHRVGLVPALGRGLDPPGGAPRLLRRQPDVDPSVPLLLS